MSTTDLDVPAAVPPATVMAPKRKLRETLLPWITTPLLLVLLIGVWHI